MLAPLYLVTGVTAMQAIVIESKHTGKKRDELVQKRRDVDAGSGGAMDRDAGFAVPAAGPARAPTRVLPRDGK